MKSLIISEDENFSNKIKPVLKECNYDVIHYKWILKAMDNVEEISPDVTIINAREYPRHWKIFSQYIKVNCGETKDNVILCNYSCNDEELNKLKPLNLTGIIKDFNQESEDELKDLLKNLGKPVEQIKEENIESENIVETESEAVSEEDEMFKVEVSAAEPEAPVESKTEDVQAEQGLKVQAGNSLLLKILNKK